MYILRKQCKGTNEKQIILKKERLSYSGNSFLSTTATFSRRSKYGSYSMSVFLQYCFTGNYLIAAISNVIAAMYTTRPEGFEPTTIGIGIRYSIRAELRAVIL